MAGTFAGILAVAFLSGAVFAAGIFAAGKLLALVSATGIAAFASGASLFALGAAVLLFASAGDSSGASGLLERTEIFPVRAGMARNRADNINTVAAPIVTFERTVAVPRGLNAVLDTLLVNKAPASVLPGCNKTAKTSTMHERKNNPYKK